jgi:response regulator RpfG family c-di-GMP phosphodiesterase
MINRVLFVDDEPNVLEGYARALRKQFSMDSATSGEEALERMNKNGPYAVIVSDMRMPGMNGVELLKTVRQRWPDTVRIMLTGNADMQTAIDAANDDHVYRFFTKPCPPETLALALDAGMKTYQAALNERELLEHTLTGAIRLLLDILAATDSRLFSRGQKLKEQMHDVLMSITGKSNWECELAAMLSPIGLITVPASVLERVRRRETLSDTESEMLECVPEAGSSLISKIPRLETTARIIRYISKNFDGSGRPVDAIAGEEIPVGSRILKVLSDLYDLQNQGQSAAAALESMASISGRHDPKVLELADKLFGGPSPATLNVPNDVNTGEAPERQVFQVRLCDLRPGMFLVHDIETVENVLVMAAGQLISPMKLELIRNFAKITGIKEPISVQIQGEG